MLLMLSVLSSRFSFSKKRFMIQPIKIFHKFVVRESFNHEAHHKQTTGTDKWGWHTGASPAVLSVLRMDGSRSDRPSLFNFNSIKMREPMDNGATCAQPEPITAEQIVKDIIIWDHPANILENLRTMILSFLMYDSPSDEEKRDVYATYFILYESLKQMQKLSI